MLTLPPPVATAHRRRRAVTLIVVLVLLAVGCAITGRVFVWPSLPAVPAHADAIVELGGPGDRASAAYALAQTHVAPVLVFSTGGRPVWNDQCLPPITGVTTMCFDPNPATTRGEAEYVGQLAQRYHWKSIILVTTPDQAWRARWRMSRCFTGSVSVSTTPLPVGMWLVQIPYQWLASAKALIFQRSC